MDAPHTLDFARLRVLENIKVSALGSQRALNDEIARVEKTIISLTKRINNAEENAKGSRSSIEPVSEAPTGIYHPHTEASKPSRTYHPDPEIQSNWSNIAAGLKAELAEAEQKKKSLTAELEETSERFNEASHLYDACKKYADNLLHDGREEYQ
jgi:predicted  nucleic acid-binding Zn-ribbon protein